MSSVSVTYYSSINYVKFDVLGATHKKSAGDAAAKARKLEGTSHHFTNLVMARANNDHILENRHATISMKMALYTHPGPFTPKQFIEMMEFSTKDPTSKWVKFMKTFKPVSLSSSEKDSESQLAHEIVTQVFKNKESIWLSLSTMSVTAPLSMSLVKFDVVDHTHMTECASAVRLARGMLSLFTNVVIARAVNVPSQQGERVDLPMEMAVWNHPGPFTQREFIKMMQFPTASTSSEWLDFMSSFTRLNPFTEKVRERKINDFGKK